MDGIYRIKTMTEIISEKTVTITGGANEYEIAFMLGCIFIGLLVLAYILSWACQWAWAWIDDKKEIDRNFVSRKLSIKKLVKGKNTDYIYPVYAAYDEDSLEKAIRRNDAYAYSNRKEDENKSTDGISSYKFDFDITRDHEVSESIEIYAFIVAGFFPMVALIMVKLYPLTLTLGTLSLVAALARFARRNHKIFIEHTKDLEAHKK